MYYTWAVHNPWKTVKRNYIYENKYGYKLRNDDVITPAGKQGKYMVLESPGYVSTVPISTSGRVIMVRQWRYPVEKEFLEIPAETMNSGEDPLKAAQRGLKEEIGGESSKWHNLGSHWLGNGAMKIQGHIFLAVDVTIGKSNQEEIERIKKELFNFENIYEMVINNKIDDYRTKLGILLAKDFLEKNR